MYGQNHKNYLIRRESYNAFINLILSGNVKLEDLQNHTDNIEDLKLWRELLKERYAELKSSKNVSPELLDYINKVIHPVTHSIRSFLAKQFTKPQYKPEPKPEPELDPETLDIIFNELTRQYPNLIGFDVTAKASYRIGKHSNDQTELKVNLLSIRKQMNNDKYTIKYGTLSEIPGINKLPELTEQNVDGNSDIDKLLQKRFLNLTIPSGKMEIHPIFEVESSVVPNGSKDDDDYLGELEPNKGGNPKRSRQRKTRRQGKKPARTQRRRKSKARRTRSKSV